MLALSFAAAYEIRLEGIPAWGNTKQFPLWLPYVMAARIGDQALTALSGGIYLSARCRLGRRSLTLVTAFMLNLRRLGTVYSSCSEFDEERVVS